MVQVESWVPPLTLNVPAGQGVPVECERGSCSAVSAAKSGDKSERTGGAVSSRVAYAINERRQRKYRRDQLQRHNAQVCGGLHY